MEQQLAGYDTVRNSESLQALANSFERIAEAEKTQWLPYYYAALSNVNLGYNYVFAAGSMGGNAEKGDPLADKAELLLSKAEALSKDNSEIFVVRKMIATLRMMGDVMNRYMTQGPAAAEALLRRQALPAAGDGRARAARARAVRDGAPRDLAERLDRARGRRRAAPAGRGARAAVAR